MGLRRGDITIVAAPGDYGKPRPALVVQADLFSGIDSVVVALITSEQRPAAPLFRRPIAPSSKNGLRNPSDVMLDKLVALPRTKTSAAIGQLTETQMVDITARLALFLGIGK
jgi:mRNA interferase MazF